MKQTRSLLNGLIACGIALAMISSVYAQSQGAATVIRIKGSARYTTGGNDWQPLKVGAVLRPGSVIQTGLEKGSYVDVILHNAGEAVAIPSASRAGTPALSSLSSAPIADQNTVRVFENTLLGIDKLTQLDTGADVITETQLDLKSGHILGSVKKMSAASKYEVKLPNGVAGIRGTVYDITSDGVIQVSSGSVVIAWVGPDGATKTQVIMAGEQFDIRTGQLTRISGDVIRFLDYTASQVRVGVAVPTTYAQDHTIYYSPPVLPQVSPTTGTVGGQ